MLCSVGVFIVVVSSVVVCSVDVRIVVVCSVDVCIVVVCSVVMVSSVVVVRSVDVRIVVLCLVGDVYCCLLVVVVQIEESILDCLAWKSDSPLWTQISALTSSGSAVPKSEEVSLQGQQQPTTMQQHPLGSTFQSPITHPTVRRLALSDSKLITKKGDTQ